MNIVELSAVAAAFFIAAASPGPANLALSSVSLSAGRASGIRFAAGLSTGLALWGVVAASGLGAVLQASNVALTILKVVGGGYLMWLAYRSARSAATPAEALPTNGVRGGEFRRGLLLNLANPKAVVAWMAILALGVNEGSGAAEVVPATLMCMVMGVMIYMTYAVAFSTDWAMGAYARARRWVEGVVAGLFALAGAGVLRSAFERQ